MRLGFPKLLENPAVNNTLKKTQQRASLEDYLRMLTFSDFFYESIMLLDSFVLPRCVEAIQRSMHST